MTIQIQVNGTTQSVDTDANTPLLYALRNDCDINSAKYGCGVGQCGSCTVIINGNAVRSCITPVGSVKSNITTLESYKNDRVLSALNKAFITEQAVQCGFCIAGVMMSAKVLLDKMSEGKVKALFIPFKLKAFKAAIETWKFSAILNKPSFG